MAKITTVELVDDLEGGPAEHSIRFSFDGTNYEIDLNEDNLEKMQEAFKPFIDVAHRTGAPNKVSARSSNTSEIREWARSQGMEVPDRGRLSDEIHQAYRDRNKVANSAKVTADEDASDELEDI